MLFMSKPMKWHHRTTFLILLVFICGCSLVHQEGDKNHLLLIETIFSGIHGLNTDREASIKWITSSEQFRVFVSGFGKQRLSNNTVSMPDINFDHSWALLIEMGQKPTGGYSVSLDKFSSCLSDETTVIRINWNTPNKDALMTQMITSPYLMLRLSKGNFKKVVVVDQEGRMRFEVKTPE